MNASEASILFVPANFTSSLASSFYDLTTPMTFNISNQVSFTSQIPGSTKNATNSTTTPSTHLNEEFLAFVKITCIFVFLLGLIGNSLVLFVFGSRWSKLKNCEIFMLSLAVADLVATVIVPVKMFLELTEHDFYPIGHIGCKTIATLSMTTVTVSALTLLVISIDRFLIVKYPLRNRPESWKIALIVLATWLISFGLSFVYLTGDRIQVWDNPEDAKSHFVCRSFMPRHESTAHALVAFVIQILIPLVVMTVLYSLITWLLRKNAKSDLFQHQQREMRARLRRNRKATILFVTLVTTYYVFVLPSNIFFLLYIFRALTYLGHQELVTIYTLLQMILMLNSCVNPIIYSNLHTSFRRITLKLFCSCISTKFKGYQWGDNVRSILRSSTRSVRGSFQSSRDLLFNRRKSTDDENHNSFSAAETRKTRRASSELLRPVSGSGFIPLSTMGHFEELDHYAASKRRNSPQTFDDIDEEDEVFRGDMENENDHTEYKNGYGRKFKRTSTCATTIDYSPPETPVLNPQPEGPLNNPKEQPIEKRKIMQALKQQQNVEED